jgi:HD-GYP domain-containing protein (c-di-GMP phosphodiesterase class II)
VTNDIISQFLQDGSHQVRMYRTYADALAFARDLPVAESQPSTAVDTEVKSAGAEVCSSPDGAILCMPYDAGEANTAQSGQEPGQEPAQDESISPDTYASDDGIERAPLLEVGSEEDPAPTAGISDQPGRTAGDEDGIIHEIFGAPAAAIRVVQTSEAAGSSAGALHGERIGADVTVDELNRQLKRRILELKTLFSISSDFNAIRDRKKLIDIFLLTAIAQGGVESAVFLENQGTCYRPLMSKGMEPDAVARLEIPLGACAVSAGENNVFPLDVFPLEPSWKSAVKKEGIEYACPFRTKDGLAGIVLLGRRIAGRGMKQEDFEFLRILLNVAQGAFDNALMFEREHERTLGIVKTLISIIEDNTLLKGTSEFVSRYVGMVAKNMDYPEEQFKDLIYGTVLRDMGMVKVSDLILRSPRDLSKEEWEIIKRHPEDGAEMLGRMKFSDHVVNIVRMHHERFNGEGYPFGLRGKEIPLGARIISVVESYAAMIHERPTRPALSEREALDTLKENYGLRYDREVVVQFSRIMEKEIAQSVHPAAVGAQGR